MTSKKTNAGGLFRNRSLTGLGVLLGLGLLGPLAVIVGSLFLESDGVWRHLASTVLPGYVRNSILLASGACLGALVIGTTVAWLVTLCEVPGRRVLEWALLLPLAVPTYIIAYTYTDFLEFAGPVQTLLRSWTGWGYGDYWFPPIRSLGGAVVTFSLVLYPYVYLMARAAFLEQSVCVLEASRTLGQSPRATFFRVAIPLARPALAAGVLLVAMESLADYGAVDYFAVDTFTTGIYRTRFSLGSAVGAAQLSALLLGLVAFLILLERSLRGGRRFHHSTNRYRELPRWELRGAGKVIATVAVWSPVVLGFGLPAGVLMGLAADRGADARWSLVMELGENSLILASVVAVLAAGISLLMVYAVRLEKTTVARLNARAVMLGYAAPGSVVAIGVMVGFGWIDEGIRRGAGVVGWEGETAPLVLGGSVFALVVAYLTRFTGVAVQAVESGMEKIAPNMDAVGRTLGERPGGLLRRVHLPLLRSSILTGGLLVFVDVLKELPATMIIRPFNFETLAVRVHHLASDERLAEAAIPALFIVLVGLIPVMVLSRMIGTSRPGGKGAGGG